MRTRLARIGVITIILLTLSTATTAVANGPEAGEGEMVIMDGGDQASSDVLDQHVSDYSIDVRFASATTASQDSVAVPDACSEDVTTARSAAEGQFCTQQTAKLSCPADESVVYQAPDGCVISSLESQGWEQVPFNRTAYNADTTTTSSTHTATLDAELTFRTAGYSIDVQKQTLESMPPQAGFVINITSPDGPAAEVLTDRSINEELTVSGTQFKNARVAVVVDGEQVLTRSFTPGDEDGVSGHPPDRPTGRIAELEQRVRTLEQQLDTVIAFVKEQHPSTAQELQQRLDSVPTDRNQSTVEQGDGAAAPSDESGRPGFVGRILGAIFG